MTPALEVVDFVVSRPAGASYALPHLVLPPGAAAVLFAPSGAGKSSLLQGLFGLLPPAAASCRGSVQLAGQAWSTLRPAAQRELLRRQVLVLLQDAAAALDPLLPIGLQLEQASGCQRPAVLAALAGLGVKQPELLAARLPHAVAGGEAQRALLALALLRRPALLVADEPSNSLDAGNYELLVGVLQRLRQDGTALLLASHDHRLLQDLAATALLPSHGVFAAGQPPLQPWRIERQRLPAGAVLLAAQGLAFAHGERLVLAGVDLTLRHGEVVALVGESGAGKTTLLRCLAGELAATGRLERPPRRTAVQLCRQQAQASLTPGRNLRSLVAEACQADFDLLRTALELQLAPPLLARSRDQLSGGEQRRATLLRALAVGPAVLLLDEPSAGLDQATATAVLQQLFACQAAAGFAVLLVTHDRDLAAAIADRVLELRAGRLCTLTAESS